MEPQFVSHAIPCVFRTHNLHVRKALLGEIGLFSRRRKNGNQPGNSGGSSDGDAAQSTMSVIDKDTILRKSPRGREEIQTREHDLTPLARRLLIMADGQHTVSDLARELACTPADSGLLETLQQLVDGRYLHISDEYDRRRRPPGGGKQATA